MTGAGAGPLYAAAVCAGAAAWLLTGRDRDLRRARLMVAGGSVDPGGQAALWERVATPVRLRLRLRREWLCVPVVVFVAVLGESVLPLLAGVVAVPLVGRRLRAGELRRERKRRADDVIALCGAVAGELRAGRQPGQALFAAASGTGGLGAAEADVMAAARFGGDVPDALGRAAREPGADGLVGMAACWRVAVDGGAGLAAGLDRLEAALRAERDQRENLRAQLAGAWATVALLALLPLAGLLIGGALGARPLRVLLHTPAGLGCLLVGGLLEGAGLFWARRIVRRGEGS
ncbi:type II secretion system F family protein [Streptomyces flavidovirens]|uniref:type II secretion system F family protein n=1 Tax=Streptomyces flavidovirens TaxID=67298 RepID=UPI0033A75D0F